LPSRDEHVQKAEGNESFASSIPQDNQSRIDWTLVVLFYAAVHYVEAYLAKSLGMHLRSHNTRDQYVGRESNLKKIFKSYAHLKFYGYNARYELYGFTAKDAADAAKDLEDIKTHLVPLL
jgi:hypothetical protein